jgi:chromatin segregation and condensation protein Rec8/ScpA/Scc1 (kleisin family)
VLQVLEVREKKIDRKKVDIRELVARYLDDVEQVTTLVDRALDRNASGRTE